MTGKERENYQRQSILVVDFIKDGFKDLLNWQITRKNITFEDFINQNQHKIYHLCFNKPGDRCCQCPPSHVLDGNRILHLSQINLLFDQTGPKHHSHRSGKCCSLAISNLSLDVLDATLARCLLQNFCSLSTSIQNATETLICIRNNVYAHVNKAGVTDTEFTTNWHKTETALLDISRLCGNEKETKQKLDDLKSRSLDETLLIQYQNSILEDIKRDNELKEHVEVLASKVDGLKTTVEGYGIALQEIKRKTKTENEEKRKKYEEISAAMIKQHTNRSVFVPTSGLTAAKESLEKRETVVLVGPPGSGKSTTAIELLRQYQCKQYVCLYLNDVTEFPNIVTVGENCIVMCDDIFGKTNCKYNPDIHSNLLDILYTYVKVYKTKIIMTIRENVQQACRQLFECNTLLHSSSIVNLGSDFEMSVTDKQECLIKHCNANDINVVNEIPEERCHNTKYITSHAIKKIIKQESSPLLGFPQACTLFTSNVHFFNQGISFFKNVNTVLLSSISDMRKEGLNYRRIRVDYTLLVYVLKNNGILDLSTYDIEKVNETCTSIYCDQNGGITCYDMEDSIDRLTGIYLKKTDTNVLIFQHRVIYEAVLLSCKSMKKDKLITFMDLEFIVEFIRPENYIATENEMFLLLNRGEYNILAHHIIGLLVRSDHPYRFVEELMTSSMIKEFGREFINVLIEMYNNNMHKFVGRIQDALVDGKTIFIKRFEFATACLLFCNNNEDLISYLISVILDNNDSIITCFLVSCIQLNQCKAKTLVKVLKSCHINQMEEVLFDVNIHNVLQMQYLTFLCDIVDDWNHVGWKLTTLMLKSALEMPDPEAADYLLRRIIKSVIDENKALTDQSPTELSENGNHVLIISDDSFFYVKTVFNMACGSRYSQSVELLLQTFDHSLFDIKTAFNIACGSRYSESVKLLLQTFDHSLFDVMTAFNMACKTGNSESVELLLNIFDRSLFDVKSAFNMACQTRRSESIIKLLLQTLYHSLFDVKAVFNMACQSGSSASVELLLHTSRFDHSLFDLKAAFNMACQSGSLGSVELLLRIFDDSLFNVKTAFNMACKNGNFETVEFLLKAFEHSLFDVKTAFNMACRSGDLKLVELLLQTFEFSSFDVKTAFNMACKSGNSKLVEFFLFLRIFDTGLFNFKRAFNMACQSRNSRSVELLLKTFDHSLFEIKTAFNTSCRSGNSVSDMSGTNIVELLLEHVDHKSINMNSGFESACKSGNIESVQILLSPTNRRFVDTTSALIAACRTCKTELVNILLNKLDHRDTIDVHSVFITAVKSESRKIILLLLQKFDHKDFDVNTVLCEAFKVCSVKTILSIIKEVDRQTINANNIMYLACAFGYPGIVEWFLQNFDDNVFDLRGIIKDIYNSTDVTTVKKMKDDFTTGRTESVKLLLGHFDHNIFDMKSMMKDACERNDVQLVSLLLKNVDQTLFNLADMFQEVCETANTQVVSFMLQNFDHQLLNVTASYKIASRKKKTDVVEIILALSKDVVLKKTDILIDMLNDNFALAITIIVIVIGIGITIVCAKFT